MFDVAPTELLLVAAVAVVVIGPKDLPKAMRVAGYWVGRARGVARQFRQGFDDMVREAEFAEMEKKWADENARIMRDFPSADTPSDLPALPAPEPAPEPAAGPAPGTAPAPEPVADEDAAPVMTAQPTLFDAPQRVEHPTVAPGDDAAADTKAPS